MSSARRRETLFWLLLAGQLALFLGWQLSHLEGFQWGSDEGIYLMRVRLLQRGLTLYGDIWTDQLPGLIEALRLTFALVGNEIVVGRGLIVCLAATGLVATVLLARKLAGRAGALCVLPLLALWPNYYWLSRAMVSPDLPAISLGAAAWAALVYRREARPRAMLILSGLLFAAACYIKATAVLAWAPAALWLLWDARRTRGLSWSRTMGELLLWGACLALPLALALALHDLPALWQQFVGTQLRGGEMALKIGPHAVKIWDYLLENNGGLLALALAGALVGWTRRRAVGWPLLWLGVSLLALLIRSPMWPSHHLIVLLYPLALLAALALAEVWRALRGRRLAWQLLPVLLSAGLYAYGAPAMLAADRELAAPPSYISSQEAIALLQARYPQGAEVVSDYHMIPYRAGCWVPPELATVTKKRIQLGMLDAEALIRISEARRPEVVLFWDEQLTQAPEYVQWVKERYLLLFKHNEHEVYVLPLPEETPRPLEATLGERVAAVGYRLDDPAALPGEEIVVTCYWRALAAVDGPLYGFCHLLDDDGDRLAQDDHLVGGEQYPAERWALGETLIDRYTLRLPADAAPGVYRLSIGLYEGEGDKHRLAVVDAAGQPLAGDQLTPSLRPVVQSPQLAQADELAQAGGWSLDPVGTLSSYDLERRGDTLWLRLLWRGATPPAWPGYAVFVHLRQGDQAATQHDGVPAGGSMPTYAWRDGEAVLDAHPLDLAGLPAGEYTLHVGLYDPATGPARARARCRRSGRAR